MAHLELQNGRMLLGKDTAISSYSSALLSLAAFVVFCLFVLCKVENKLEIYVQETILSMFSFSMVKTKRNC